MGRYFKGVAFEKGLQLLIAGQKFSLRKKNELTHLNIIANQLSGPPLSPLPLIDYAFVQIKCIEIANLYKSLAAAFEMLKWHSRAAAKMKRKHENSI